MFTRTKLIKNKYLIGLSSFGIQYGPGGKVSNSLCCAVTPSLSLQKNESMLWILKPFQYAIKLMLMSFVLMLLLCQFETGKQSLSIYWKHCSSTGKKKENREKIQTSIWYLKRNTSSPVLAAGSPTCTQSPLPAIVKYPHMSTTQKCSAEQKSIVQRLSCHSSQAVTVLLSWCPTSLPSSGQTGTTTFFSLRADEHKRWTQT